MYGNVLLFLEMLTFVSLLIIVQRYMWSVSLYSSSASPWAFTQSTYQNHTKCCLVPGCPTIFSGEVSSRWHWLKHTALTGPLCWETGAIWNSQQASRVYSTRPNTYHPYLGHWDYNSMSPRYISQGRGEEKQVHATPKYHHIRLISNQNMHGCHYKNESQFLLSLRLWKWTYHSPLHSQLLAVMIIAPCY